MGISGLVAGSWQLRGLTGFFRVMAPEGSEKVGQLKVLQVALLQGVIKVFSHPEAGATGGASLGLGYLVTGWPEFCHRPPVFGDLEDLPVRHDLSDDGTELGLGLKDSYPPHEKQTSLTSLYVKAQN